MVTEKDVVNTKQELYELSEQYLEALTKMQQIHATSGNIDITNVLISSLQLQVKMATVFTNFVLSLEQKGII